LNCADIGYNTVTVIGTDIHDFDGHPENGLGCDSYAVTTSNVNLRSGPSTGQPVIRVIAKGVAVDITDRVQNGYRYIYIHFGPGGWVIDSALSRVAQPGRRSRPPPPSTCALSPA
jgi:SH3-like domain-containing protein